MTNYGTHMAQCEGKDKLPGYVVATRIAKRRRHEGVAAYRCPCVRTGTSALHRRRRGRR